MNRPVALLALLLLTGCGGGSPVSADVDGLCGLAELPHGSSAELRAVAAAAQTRVQQKGAFASTPRNRAIAQAALRLGVAAEGEAQAQERPQFSHPPLPGVPPYDEAVTALRQACRR